MEKDDQFLLFVEQTPDPKPKEKTEREKELDLLYEKVLVW